MLTPLELEVLIHCHVTPVVHPRYEAMAVQAAIKWFLSVNLIECSGDKTYCTTEKGKVYMNMICSTPFPIQKWVNGNNEIVGGNE